MNCVLFIVFWLQTTETNTTQIQAKRETSCNGRKGMTQRPFLSGTWMTWSLNLLILAPKPLLCSVNPMSFNILSLITYNAASAHLSYFLCLAWRKLSFMQDSSWKITGKDSDLPGLSQKHTRSQVANTRPSGRIWPWPSTSFYPIQHLISTQWQRWALA